MNHVSRITLARMLELSGADMEHLRLLAIGLSFGEIAATLHLPYKEVANRSSALISKLGLANTADLIRLSRDVHLI